MSFSYKGILWGWDAVDLVLGDLDDVGAGAEGSCKFLCLALFRWSIFITNWWVPLLHGKMGSGGEEIKGGSSVLRCNQWRMEKSCLHGKEEVPERERSREEREREKGWKGKFGPQRLPNISGGLQGQNRIT